MTLNKSNCKPDAFHFGYVTIIGRPNVGKSTLLNRLIGEKLSITSRKPQTTQRRLLGIKTNDSSQVVYIDTPGIQSKYKDAMNRYMHREIKNALSDIDVLILMVEALKWMPADNEILELIKDNKTPTMLVINKVDKIKDKDKLLPYIRGLSAKKEFIDVVPISSSKNINIVNLENSIRSFLPIGVAEFPEDHMTDRSERYLASEYIREKLIQKLGEELPYRITVTIDKFAREKHGLTIEAMIWVESDSQKAIVIGKDGGFLKSVGEQSRKDMERLFDEKVFLRTWVKVKKNWTENQNLLKQFGFEN
jgi:GTPase